MPDKAPLRSFVIDASVAAKLHFIDAESDLAAAVVRSAENIIAPELLYAEMASVAAKQVRRGVASREHAALAIESLRSLLEEAVALSGLARRAFDLAARGFSAYDGVYLALAEARGLAVLTADDRLARHAHASRLGHLVRALV